MLLRTYTMPVRLGDELVLRVTNERVVLLGVLDASGTLLVAKLGEDPFQVGEDEVMTLVERASGCPCC